jgi:hypothetical protein
LALSAFWQEGLSFPRLALPNLHLFLLKMLITVTTASGEEVSVSLGYALGLQTDQTPPIHASKGTPPEKTKTEWIPKITRLGLLMAKEPRKDQSQRHQQNELILFGEANILLFLTYQSSDRQFNC